MQTDLIHPNIIEQIDNDTHYYLIVNPVNNRIFLCNKTKGVLAFENQGTADLFIALFPKLHGMITERSHIEDVQYYANGWTDGKITLVTIDDLKSLRYNQKVSLGGGTVDTIDLKSISARSRGSNPL